MAEPTLEAIEDDLERASELETGAALEVLEDARVKLRRLEDVDAERRAEIDHRLEQRLREVGERDAYDGGLGSAMNPEDDDAP